MTMTLSCRARHRYKASRIVGLVVVAALAAACGSSPTAQNAGGGDSEAGDGSVDLEKLEKLAASPPPDRNERLAHPRDVHTLLLRGKVTA